MQPQVRMPAPYPYAPQQVFQPQAQPLQPIQRQEPTYQAPVERIAVAEPMQMQGDSYEDQLERERMMARQIQAQRDQALQLGA